MAPQTRSTYRRGSTPSTLEWEQVTSSSELCAGLPQEFADYMNYVHDLRDKDWPDYQHFRKMFTKLFRRQGFEDDKVFDWTIREFQRLDPEAQEPFASKHVWWAKVGMLRPFTWAKARPS
jgi:casein kinase I family protein HRR25